MLSRKRLTGDGYILVSENGYWSCQFFNYSRELCLFFTDGSYESITTRCDVYIHTHRPFSQVNYIHPTTVPSDGILAPRTGDRVVKPVRGASSSIIYSCTTKSVLIGNYLTRKLACSRNHYVCETFAVLQYNTV